MGELPPSATSQGVDLFELERLRVLVRFEFDRDLTQEELVVALTRCHNNTREAYHFLKEQRRQAQLQAAAEMVAAATATSHSTASAAAAGAHGSNGHVAHDYNNHNNTTATTSTNGGKRRNGSDGSLDGDVQMDTPNKRHRSSTADAMTIDLSQANDNVDMTQSTQQEDSESASPTRGRRPRHYNLERASQLISDTVTKIMKHKATRASVDDVQWLSAAVEALAVKRTPGLDEPLAVVVEALANALKHVPVTDVAAVQSDGVKQILEVLKQLPRQDQYTMDLRLEPSTEKMNEDVGKVENTFAYALADHMKKSERAQAARNTISVIKDALSACITRQESMMKSVKDAQLHRTRVRARVGDLKNDIQAQLEQAGKDVKSSEHDMVQARNNKLVHTAAVMQIVMQHKKALVSQGDDEDSATLNAHEAIVVSTDPKVVRMRQEREESELLYKVRRQDVMRANTRLEFYQKLEALRQKVLPSVQDWLLSSARQVQVLSEEVECDMEDRVKMYVSKMTQSLRLYYEFHTMRQLIATKDREKQKETLTEHMEFYDDLAPSSKKEIEKKISEFSSVILHSTQVMREVASLQCELWEGKRESMERVFPAVLSEYGKLYDALSGGAKDMMLDCVNVIRNQPPATPMVSSPVLVPANVAAIATVTPYEFVGREFDSHRAQPVRSTSFAPTSPVVDLTGDEDGDVTMDGSLRERFVFTPSQDNFSNQSTDEVARPGAEPTFSVVKMEEKPSEPEIPRSVREFPMGSLLCWMQKDEFGELDGVYTGHVKGRTPGGSYILEDAEGLEHVIPVTNLFTHEEKEAFSRQQHQDSNEEGPNKEGCVLM